MVAILLLAACGERQTETFTPDDPAAFYSYYPLELGKYLEYRVDSVVYDPSLGNTSLRDSSVTYVREVLADTLRDNTGALLYTIERYERTDSTDWSLQAIWTCAINEVGAIRTENNLRFLKLIFPLDRRSAWDGNLYIDTDQLVEIANDETIQPFQNWFYDVDSINGSASVGGFTFDSTLPVTEVDETNAIARRLSRVRYGRGVGRVWREQWILDSRYCNQTLSPVDGNSKPWQDKAERGYILRQTRINYN